MNHPSLYSWVEKFTNDQKSVDTEQKSRFPVEVSTQLLKNNIKKVILANRWVTIEEISLKFGRKRGYYPQNYSQRFEFPKNLCQMRSQNVNPST